MLLVRMRCWWSWQGPPEPGPAGVDIQQRSGATSEPGQGLDAGRGLPPFHPAGGTEVRPASPNWDLDQDNDKTSASAQEWLVSQILPAKIRAS
jgi:hypothetical protein